MNYKPHINHVLEVIKSEGFDIKWMSDEDFKKYSGYVIYYTVYLPVNYDCGLDFFRAVVHELQHLRQNDEGVNYKYDTRKEILKCEYDADQRSWEFIKQYKKAKVDKKWYIERANRYSKYIKWRIEQGTNERFIKNFDRVKSIKVLNRWMTDKELFEKLSESDYQKFENYYKKYCEKI